MRTGMTTGALLALSTPAWAQNVDNVDRGTTHPTIAAAIAAADPGDTLLLVAASFDEEVTVDRSLTIEGDGATTLSSPGPVIFTLAAGVTFDLSEVVVAPLPGDTELRAISAVAGGNVIRLSDSTITTGDPTADGPAIHAIDPVRVTVTRATFLNAVPGTPSADEGGAIWVQSATPAPVTLTDTVFERTEADRKGGAVFVSGADLTCTRCAFERTESNSGGAIYTSGGTLVVDQSSFCEIETRSPNGSGAVLGENEDVTIRASRFVETDSTVDASALLGLAGSVWTVTNNTFVGNGGDAVVTFDEADDADLVNNLFYDNDGFAVTFGLPGMRVSYSWFEDNVGGDVLGGIFDITNRLGPPEVVSWTRNGDCDDDQLWPQPSSGLIDAGDPTLLDPDGSRSDIGAYGGPSADPAFHDDDDGDGFTFVQDCNDGEPDAFPGAPEICDGIDDDCDGLVDDGDPDIVGQDTYYADCDFDGQGAGAPRVQCDAPQAPPLCGGAWLSLAEVGSLATSDCDDTDPGVFTGAAESCDGVDDDCDDLVDDDDPGITGQDSFFTDCDADGQGTGAPVVQCFVPAGPACGGDWLSLAVDGALTTADCDDTDPAVFTGATESCDTVDDDCDGLVDDEDPDIVGQDTFYADCDGDGQGAGAPTVQCTEPPPPACGGDWRSVSEFGIPASSDCDDEDPTVHIGAPELCLEGDQNCDGDDDLDATDSVLRYLDADGDTYGAGPQVPTCGETPPEGTSDRDGDCDDTEPTSFPGARDDCGDHVDQDCNGGDGNDVTIREWYVDADGDGYGDPDAEPALDCAYELDGFTTNTLDCDDTNGDVNPGESEVCNGLDDDCANGVDDGEDLCLVEEPPPEIPVIRPAGSCATGPGPAAPPWGLLGLLFLARRRRS